MVTARVDERGHQTASAAPPSGAPAERPPTAASEGELGVRRSPLALSKFRPPEVAIRDRRTLEVRQFFPLPTGAATDANFSLEAFLYFPPSFQINADTLDTETFYKALQVYMRLHAPQHRLRDLADLRNAHNPGAVLRRLMPQLLDDKAPPAASLAALAQMFGSELADAASSGARHLSRRIAALETAAVDVDAVDAAEDRAGLDREREQLERAIRAFSLDAQRALGAIRRVRAKASAYRGVAPQELFSALAFAEEYATAMLDEHFARLGLKIDNSQALRDGTGRATRMRLALADAAAAVNRRRLEQGFGVPWGSSPEYFAYRLSLIKKEVQRSLYVDMTQTKSDPFFVNSAAMVAAGLAATWATLAQLPLWTGGWSTRQGVLFLGAAVGAYILKDRIKEWTRNGLVRRFRTWDHVRKIAGDALSRVGLGGFDGTARDRVAFLDDDSVPETVHRVRVAERTVRGLQPELEHVLRYQRETRFAPKEALPPGFGVQELVRLSLDPFIARLDDPTDVVSFYDHSRGRFVQAEMPKVYHLNVVLLATDRVSGLQHRTRTRVVVNQEGIVRLDPVSSESEQLEEVPAKL